MNLHRGRNNPTSDFVEITEPLGSLCALRSWGALHVSSLRLSLRSLRLCVEKTASSTLISGRRLPFQDLFQNIVLFQPIALRMEVQQNPVPQYRAVERPDVLVGQVIPALHQGSRFGRQYQELRRADAA